MSKITITVSGTTRSGKSFIKYQIAKHLNDIGLNVNVEENELNDKAVIDRIHSPKKFVKSINEKKLTIKVTEKQLNRLLSTYNYDG